MYLCTNQSILFLGQRINILKQIQMAQFLTMFGLIFGVFFVSFLLINIRQIVTGNDFRGTCAQNNPLLKSKVGECGLCGKKGDEACKNPDLDKRNNSSNLPSISA